MGSDTTMRGVVLIRRRSLVLPVKICYRSVCNHPFLTLFACFFAVLYRSFPLLFALLVTTSPVLVCTAVLLGTLLSFGELNIPEVEVERDGVELADEEDEEISHVISSLRAAQAADGIVVAERGGSFGLEKLVVKRNDVSAEDDTLTEDEFSKIGQDDNAPDIPLVNENSPEELHEEVIEEKAGKKEGFGSFGNFQVTENDGDHEEEEERDDKGSDSESDRAESSSPDASLADIIPMLDELHPLLDEEAPQLAERSVEASEPGSETSGRSKESNIESDDDTEDQGEEDDVIDDNDHGGEEEGKDDESKSAIKWTEDDQKNLLDLGSLELERNQHLECLIARRRARRNMRLMAEKNLIDLDGSDVTVNIPLILATRQNPFDLPYDLPYDPYDDIPGSAPSILLPRKNPFDIPYEPNEEKPDLKGDNIHQEFSAPSQKEPVFRRHESFSVGPSVLGFPQQERQDLRWKPYFVPERFSGEGTSVSTFQRQLSEVSESKLSSVQDTESASSVVEDEEIEEEEKKVNGEDVSHVEDHVSLLVELGSFASEDVDTMDVEEIARNVQHNDGDGDELHTSSSDVDHRHVEQYASEILQRMGLDEDEYSSESIISRVNQGSPIPQESINQSSLESQLHNPSEVVDNHQHREPVTETIANHIGESNEHEQPGSPKQQFLEAESRYLSEAQSDNLHEEHDGDSGVYCNDESGTSGKTSTDSGCHVTGAVMDDSHHKDPVYDSSPASSGRFLSFRSVSSDTLQEILEMSSPPALAALPVIKSELQPDIANNDSSHHKEIVEGYLPKEMEVKSPEDEEVNDDGSVNHEDGVDLNYDNQNGSTKAGPDIQHALVTLHSLATDRESLKEGGVYEEERYCPEANQPRSSNQCLVETSDSCSSTPEEHLEQEMTQSSGLDPNTHDDVFKTEGSISRASNNEHMHANGTIISGNEEGQPDGVATITNQATAPPETMHVWESSSRKEEAPELEKSHAHYPTSDAKVDIGDQDVYKEVVYAKEKSSPHLEKWYSWSDKSMVESSSDIHDISSEPFSNPTGGIEEVSINEKTSTPEADDKEDTVSVAPVTSDLAGRSPEDVECSSSSLGEDTKEDTLDKIVYETNSYTSEHSNHSSESYECFSAEEDEIKEIDEKLLSELDTVGDFRVKEVVGESTQDEKIVERSVIGESEVNNLPNDRSRVSDGPEIPVREVQSVEDVEFALEQLHRRENSEEVILPCMTDNETESISDFPTTETSSLEDVRIVMKQASEEGTKEQPESSYSKERVVELNEEDLVELHQVDEISETIDVQEAIIPSRIGNQMVMDESEDTVKTSSDIPFVEADSEAASKQLSESNKGERPRLSDTMDEPLEVLESIFVQEIEPRDIETNILQDQERNTLELGEVDSTNGVGLINEHHVIPDAIDFHEVQQVVEVTSASSNDEENSGPSSSSSSNDSRD